VYQHSESDDADDNEVHAKKSSKKHHDSKIMHTVPHRHRNVVPVAHRSLASPSKYYHLEEDDAASNAESARESSSRHHASKTYAEQEQPRLVDKQVVAVRSLHDAEVYQHSESDDADYNEEHAKKSSKKHHDSKTLHTVPHRHRKVVPVAHRSLASPFKYYHSEEDDAASNAESARGSSSRHHASKTYAEQEQPRLVDKQVVAVRSLHDAE
ncbi:hypothetical protein ILUMI_16388, partial [Ignelater luminosus]